jgi:DNA polymerase-3 subunit epsilon
MTSFAVVDLETTGLHPGAHHRIVEIGVALVGIDGEIEYQWDTLVNPHRDLGPTAIHGITASMVLDAPSFGDVAGDLSALFEGRVVVAHNARFDTGFLEAEWSLLGLVRQLDALCTMSLARRRGAPAKLSNCCMQFGIENTGAHRALADAVATARLLQRLDPSPGELPGPARFPPPPAVWVGLRYPRPIEPAVVETELVSQLVRRLPSTGTPGVDAPEGIADAYWNVLDHALEDRVLTSGEASDLAGLAESWNLTLEATEQIHLAYLTSLLAVAAADGIVTSAELIDVERVADLLGVDRSIVISLIEAGSVVGHAPDVQSVPADLAGKTVCFTGASSCVLDGEVITREHASILIATLGLVAVNSVTKKLDLLVVADPDTQSSKAQKARANGTRIVGERAFWNQLGVAVD